jgi:hypothetical protein
MARHIKGSNVYRATLGVLHGLLAWRWSKIALRSQHTPQLGVVLVELLHYFLLELMGVLQALLEDM